MLQAVEKLRYFENVVDSPCMWPSKPYPCLAPVELLSSVVNIECGMFDFKVIPCTPLPTYCSLERMFHGHSSQRPTERNR